MTTETPNHEAAALTEIARAGDSIREKLADALTPGFQAEFDPDEAERAGAFIEDALTEEEALESNLDLADAAFTSQK